MHPVNCLHQVFGDAGNFMFIYPVNIRYKPVSVL